MSGVSIAAISRANEMQARRVLIVCRARDRLAWLEAWRAQSPMPRNGNFGLWPIMSARHGVPDTAMVNAAVITISPEILRNPDIRAALRSMPLDLVIVSTGPEPKLGTWAELIEPSRGSVRSTGSPYDQVSP